jgi:outer membrane protein assembly factor BamB
MRIVSTMRVILAVVVVLLAAPLALAGSIPEPVVLSKQRFPAPARDITPSGPRLVLVSSRYRDPGTLPPERPAPPSWAPRTFKGAALESAVRQQGKLFLVYEGRHVVGATARTQALRYAYDLTALTRPPNRGEFEPVTWAREVDGVLYVSNSHLTYATQTNGRNAYLTAIEVGAKKSLWRSPALVANARTFVVTGDLIVAGYGFTAEPDFLYVLDRRTGKVLERLAVPSAPEIIKLRGDLLHVRTYDRQLVVRLRS